MFLDSFIVRRLGGLCSGASSLKRSIDFMVSSSIKVDP